MQVTSKTGLGLTILGMLAAAAVPALAGAPPVPPVHLYSTGVDDNGQALANGATGSAGDQHYTLTYISPSATLPLEVRTSAGGYPIDLFNGPYIGDSSASAWIGPVSANHSLFGAPGYYDYQTTFVLPVGSNAVTGLWATDNAGVDILVNGQSSGNKIGTTSGAYEGFRAYTPFTLSNGFVNGTATVDFIVYNDGGPTALRVNNLHGATVAPEPSSFAVFGFLGLGMAGLMLKARKRSASAA
jgi:hypothetical protein